MNVEELLKENKRLKKQINKNYLNTLKVPADTFTCMECGTEVKTSTNINLHRRIKALEDELRKYKDTE